MEWTYMQNRSKDRAQTTTQASHHFMWIWPLGFAGLNSCEKVPWRSWAPCSDTQNIGLENRRQLHPCTACMPSSGLWWAKVSECHTRWETCPTHQTEQQGYQGPKQWTVPSSLQLLLKQKIHFIEGTPARLRVSRSGIAEKTITQWPKTYFAYGRL